MKRFTLLLAFVFLTLFLGAQTISKSFTISSSDVQLFQSGGYTHLDLKNGYHENNSNMLGYPDLPFIHTCKSSA